MNILEQQEFWKQIESTILEKAQSGRFTWRKTSIEILDYIKETLDKEGIQPSQLQSRAGSSSCQCTMVSFGGKPKIKAYAMKTQSISLRLLKTSNQDDGHFTVLEMKKSGTEV